MRKFISVLFASALVCLPVISMAGNYIVSKKHPIKAGNTGTVIVTGYDGHKDNPTQIPINSFPIG